MLHSLFLHGVLKERERCLWKIGMCIVHTIDVARIFQYRYRSGGPVVREPRGPMVSKGTYSAICLGPSLFQGSPLWIGFWLGVLGISKELRWMQESSYVPRKLDMAALHRRLGYPVGVGCLASRVHWHPLHTNGYVPGPHLGLKNILTFLEIFHFLFDWRFSKRIFKKEYR